MQERSIFKCDGRPHQEKRITNENLNIRLKLYFEGRHSPQIDVWLCNWVERHNFRWRLVFNGVQRTYIYVSSRYEGSNLKVQEENKGKGMIHFVNSYIYIIDYIFIHSFYDQKYTHFRQQVQIRHQLSSNRQLQWRSHRVADSCEKVRRRSRCAIST